jgi:hypothetical protein
VVILEETPYYGPWGYGGYGGYDGYYGGYGGYYGGGGSSLQWAALRAAC